MKTETISVRVRYQETDQMGVVYHANYLTYFELGRVEWLRSKGLDYAALEKSGVLLPVVNVTVNYQSPARYDQLIKVVTTIEKIGGASVVFYTQIIAENETVLVDGRVTLVATDAKNFKPIKLPDQLRSLIEEN